jgi:putative CocE/NonD family hydrolase
MILKGGSGMKRRVMRGLFTFVCALVAVTGTAGADDLSYPLNVLEDEGAFTFYLNEEVLVTGTFTWEKDGTFSSAYKLTMAGQTLATTFEIIVDDKGDWTKMFMETPRGPVTVTREGDKAKIETDETKTVDLKAGTLLFENFSPALMSQAVIAYDQEAGGEQVFPLFIVPGAVFDLKLERLETAERTVMGRRQQFTLYRYGLPGVDVILWVDGANRVVFGDVPAQHGAYVRDGYEVLMTKEVTDSLISQAEFEVVVDRNTGVPMRDGLELATDIYRPDADGTFPVILVRTPYKKELNELEAMFYARRGYVYAVQDCRGRFSSPGTWVPFFNEPHDGYDTIEWLAVQPWSSGKVGMIGGSYLGWVQWWAARETPPHLTTMIPNVSPPDPYYNIPYEYGVFFLWGAIWWADVLEEEATADLSGKAMSDIMDKEYATLLRHLPVVDLDKMVLGKENPYWRDWIQHPDNDQYWAPVSFLDHLENLDIPVYHQSGWFDGDGIGSKLNYLAMVRYGHGNQKLILGPWGHTTTATRSGPRDTDFGPNATVDLERSYLRWLDRWLKGIQNGIEREPLVNLFVMNTNKWLNGNTYPLEGTEFTRMYLASDGRANTSSGNGRLIPVLPPADAATHDTFIYDPGDPTPTPYFYQDPADLEKKEGTDEQETYSVEEKREAQLAYHAKVTAEREDILVYETAPLEEPLTFAGPISGVVYAASSARDTDWFMRLAWVDADGGIFPLVQGVIRARYRSSFSVPQLLEPGEIYEYHLDMWQTGVTVPEGAKLRVEVASAAFPIYSRNLNTGGHNETETEYVTAEQKIYHDPDHPSYVLLPVIPAPDFVDTVTE